jgi:rubredoxin
MNSVIFEYEVMERWLENQPDPDIYYQCSMCLNLYYEEEGINEVSFKRDNHIIKDIICYECQSSKDN